MAQWGKSCETLYKVILKNVGYHEKDIYVWKLNLLGILICNFKTWFIYKNSSQCERINFNFVQNQDWLSQTAAKTAMLQELQSRLPVDHSGNIFNANNTFDYIGK